MLHSQAQVCGFWVFPRPHCTGMHWQAQVCGLVSTCPEGHDGQSHEQVSALRTRGNAHEPAVHLHWQVEVSNVKPGG